MLKLRRLKITLSFFPVIFLFFLQSLGSINRYIHRESIKNGILRFWRPLLVPPWSLRSSANKGSSRTICKSSETSDYYLSDNFLPSQWCLAKLVVRSSLLISAVALFQSILQDVKRKVQPSDALIAYPKSTFTDELSICVHLWFQISYLFSVRLFGKSLSFNFSRILGSA